MRLKRRLETAALDLDADRSGWLVVFGEKLPTGYVIGSHFLLLTV
jgi:hypothetical protein